MRRRLDLAAGLVTDPEVLLLDEPTTTGLDPRSRQAVWDVVTGLTASGVTVFLTTQYLEEADRLADTIAVIDAGHVVARGTADELKREVGGSRLDVFLDGPGAFYDVLSRLGARAVHVDRGTSTIGVASDGAATAVRALLDEVDPDRDRVTRFTLHTATLDDVFLALTARPTSPQPTRASTPMSDTLTGTAFPRATGPRTGLFVASTLVARAWRLSLRNVDGLITALVLPVMLMLMFGYLFGGAIDVGGHYVDYVVPGVLLVCVSFGAATTAVSVAHDLAGPVIDRFRSVDVRGEALVNGHVVASVARNLVSAAVVVAVGFAIGFRSHAGVLGWLAAGGVLALLVLALSWFAAAVGILTRSAEAASGVGFLVSFPAYPGSAFVPIATMPGWLQAFARNQPVTAVVDAIRALLAGAAVGADAWHAAIWRLGIIVVSVSAGGALFRRRIG